MILVVTFLGKKKGYLIRVKCSDGSNVRILGYKLIFNSDFLLFKSVVCPLVRLNLVHCGVKMPVVQLGLKLNTKLGLDQHPPPIHPPPTTNFSKGSRLGRRLRFYT